MFLLDTKNVDLLSKKVDKCENLIFMCCFAYVMNF